MENRAEQNFSPIADHEDAVAIQGLDDLFQWASETVAEGLDGRARRARDQNIRRQVLNIIHSSAHLQAKAKHADELAYLQRRVIALQGALGERTAEVLTLKQIAVSQYHVLQRVPEFEEKIVQLTAQCKQKEQLEEDRKYLTSVVSGLNQEKQLLEDLVSVNESENTRLVGLLTEARAELKSLRNRRWWHMIFPPKLA